MHHIKPGTRDHEHWKWLRGSMVDLPIVGSKWLDIGCGTGLVSAELASTGAKRSVGIDIVKPEASQTVKGWEFFNLDLNDPSWEEKIPESEAGFDVVTCFDILEHLDSPVHFILKLKSLLAPGGHIVLTTPNTNSWERVIRGERWSGATDPQHKILFSIYSLRFLMERLGFVVNEIRAPIRKLDALRIPHPRIGAQIFLVARQA